MGKHGRDDDDEADVPQDTDDEVHRGVSSSGKGKHGGGSEDEDDD